LDSYVCVESISPVTMGHSSYSREKRSTSKYSNHTEHSVHLTTADSQAVIIDAHQSSVRLKELGSPVELLHVVAPNSNDISRLKSTLLTKYDDLYDHQLLGSTQEILVPKERMWLSHVSDDMDYCLVQSGLDTFIIILKDTMIKIVLA
jgi:hypothetical protein